MASLRMAGTVAVAAAMAALAGLAGPGERMTAGGAADGSGAVAMREIVHIQATPAPARSVPATGGTIISES
jgi:hypothetical protein